MTRATSPRGVRLARLPTLRGSRPPRLRAVRWFGAGVTDPPYSSGGAFRGDRAQQTTTKYVNSDTAAYRPEFAGDNRDQRSFCAWATMWLSAFAIVRAVNRAAGVEP